MTNGTTFFAPSDPCIGRRLTIDIATVNGENSGAGPADGKPLLDHPSRESDVFDEEPDELEVDLDTPWVKPSVERAKKAGKVRSKPSAAYADV